MHTLQRCLTLVCCLLATAALAGGPESPFVTEWKAWHALRLEELRRPVGWLSLSGLHWLEPGENHLDGISATFVLEKDEVRFIAPASAGWTLDGAPVTSRALRSDALGKADRLTSGSRVIQIIDRSGKRAVRVWDTESPLRQALTDIEAFPADPRWRLEARWERYDVPREVEVPSKVGIPTRERVPGRAHFSVGGKEYSLEPTLEGDGLFFVFKDATAPKETYGGGRFLDAAAPQGGKVILDFNRAYNPPCVFTPFATCPLPLPQNVLPLRIDAGEKKWGH